MFLCGEMGRAVIKDGTFRDCMPGYSILGTWGLGSTEMSPFFPKRENAEEEEIINPHLLNVLIYLLATLFQKSSEVGNKDPTKGKGSCGSGKYPRDFEGVGGLRALGL